MPVEVWPIIDGRRQSLQAGGFSSPEVTDYACMLGYERASLQGEGSYKASEEFMGSENGGMMLAATRNNVM